MALEAHLGVCGAFLPHHHGVPTGRWLNALMNRIDPGLFSNAFVSWARETWPGHPDLFAIVGKTSRRMPNPRPPRGKQGAAASPLRLRTEGIAAEVGKNLLTPPLASSLFGEGCGWFAEGRKPPVTPLMPVGGDFRVVLLAVP
jgi:hypothetical protein